MLPAGKWVQSIYNNFRASVLISFLLVVTKCLYRPNYEHGLLSRLSISKCIVIKDIIIISVVVTSVSIIYSLIGISAWQHEAQSRPALGLNNENITSHEAELNPEPQIKDKNIKAELVFEGMMNPTSMAFLADNDILFLELFNGTVFRLIDGVLQPEPILDVNVSRVVGERGMLGIAVTKELDRTYVFLYYTEANVDNGLPIGNRLYRYEFTENKLVNPKLILDLPVYPGPFHNGGAITIGPDGNVYIPIGNLEDVDAEVETFSSTKTQNIEDGEKPDGSGGILRVTPDGKVVGDGILSNEYPLNLYYAYGIRNSFGIDFDPVTGNLWDTENGPNYGDEINLVEPGFNSGWRRVQGIWYDNHHEIGNTVKGIPQGLVDFNGKGKYSDPEFTWKSKGPGLTALKFLDSDKLGKQYENDIFVGDVHNGNLYYFKIDENRKELMLDPPLDDKVVEDEEELEDIIFGQGFTGGITDIELGEDGYLYIVSGIWSDEGKIYRLIPITE